MFVTGILTLKMASSDSTVTGTVVETHTHEVGRRKEQKENNVINFLPFIRVFWANLSNSVKLPYIEISSWEVVTYGIYARVNLFSQNERASATSE